MVNVGDRIISITDNRELIVDQVLPIGFTSYNFSARYITPAGVDKQGNNIYGNRGFCFKDKGAKWVKKRND